MHRVMTMASTCLFTVLFLTGVSTVSAGTQQDRMRSCNEEAKKQDLHGEDRKDFMSACLSGHASDGEHNMTAQQGKMRECHKEAKDKNLKGDDRKKFMSDCLKG